MRCEKKDCKHYDSLSKTFCGRLGEGNCDKYTKERKPRKLKTIIIPRGEKTLHISKKYYDAFMKIKNIVIYSVDPFFDGLVIEYKSKCGKVTGKVKFKDLGESNGKISAVC